MFAQTRSEAPSELNILDPETVYSFTGLNGEGFLRRSPVNLPQPLYRGTETGLVPLQFSIKPDGSVTDVRLVPPLLPGTSRDMVNAAVNAVKQWAFAPLPASMTQELMDVHVVIQYNEIDSGVLYSSDGSCIMTGLDGRKPAHIYKPQLQDAEGMPGIVNAVVGVKPDGSVRGIYRYYGGESGEEIPPRLGIITYEALRTWTFDALPAPLSEEEQAPQDQEVTITFRFTEGSVQPRQ
ncbi:MAG: energy transducer TonB [Bacteroidia bacterium]|nr:energy transducer TonB [Bacteroidia bacterium]